jgi:alpha-galactosidase
MTLEWNIVLADGTTRQGSASVPVTGPVHLVCDLPEGILASVTATLDLSMAPDEKIFLNGYQTWTHCPEYGPKDKIRGLHGVPHFLVKQYSFDRYGDYHFVDYPNRRGVTHGVSYGYLRQGETFRLFASLDEQPGYTLFQFDSKRGQLTLRRDCAGVRCGGPFHAFDLYFARGTENAVFDGWFAALGLPAPTAPPLAGYTSWYHHYEAISEEAIRADLAGCRTLLDPGDLFQIDDGWEPAVGDWLEPDPAKFPAGLRPLADDIHAAGFRAGLWLAPFVARKGSQLADQHPDWLLKVDGGPWLCGCNWGGFYSLDLDHPGVQDYLRQVFHRVLTDWDFDLVKLDFLYGAAPFGTETESRAGRMIRAMDFLRALVGDKRILGCGVPVMPAFGRVDYCRVGCDVGLDWDDKPYMRLFHRERVSTRQSIDNTIFRRQLHGRAWVSDPDVFFLRDTDLRLTEQQKTMLSQVNALLGGVLLTSDDPGAYSEAQRRQYQALRRLTQAEDVRVEADDGLRVRYRLDGEERCVTVR